MHLDKIYLKGKPVLITGNTGTGKSYLAKKIHDHSTRSRRPFKQINLASIDESLFNSMIFGHRKGSFTGASESVDGLCSATGEGTLFMDEIGEISISKQAALLTLIDENRYYPVGSSQSEVFKGSFIFATNANLEEMVAEGRFRKDLYFRLRYINIILEPLQGDIEKLKSLVTTEIKRNSGRKGCVVRFSNKALKALHLYDWPGNFRELRNTIEYLFELDVEEVCLDHLPHWFKSSKLVIGQAPTDFKLALQNFEKSYLISQLKKYNGKINLTSECSGMNKVTLISKLKKYGIDKNLYKDKNFGRLIHGF